MTPSTRLLSSLVLLLGATPIAAQTNGLTLKPGWPINVPGSTVDGGALVNLDDDYELEVVFVAGSSVGSSVYAFNEDGTSVPGWPRAINAGTFSAPAVGDLDGDGRPELVVHSFFFGLDATLYAFHADGSNVSGFPTNLGGPLKGACLADLDGDGYDEIVTVQNVGGFGTAFALDGDGTDLPGWPVTLDDVTGSAASVADVDGDGQLEIALLSFSSLYLFGTDGSIRPGFPVSPGGNRAFNYNTPTFGDLDGDSDLEIVTASSEQFSSGGRVHVFQHDGSNLTGWPKVTSEAVLAPVTVADVDSDGRLDVVAGDQILSPIPVNQLYAWDPTGTPLPGFPVGPIDAIFAQVIVVDVDGDDEMELLYDSNVSGIGLQAVNKDGTPVDGWPLDLTGGSFQQSATIADGDLDGLFEVAVAGNDGVNAESNFYLFTSSLAEARPDLAPAPTHGMTAGRDFRAGARGSVRSIGCGFSPLDSLRVLAGEPRIAKQTLFGVENTLGNQPAGALAFLVASNGADPNFPCGTVVPNLGMNGPYGPGELLVSLLGAFSQGPIAWPGAGQTADFAVDVPNDVTLIGEDFTFQGVLWEVGVGFALTNGLAVVVGE